MSYVEEHNISCQLNTFDKLFSISGFVTLEAAAHLRRNLYYASSRCLFRLGIVPPLLASQSSLLFKVFSSSTTVYLIDQHCCSRLSYYPIRAESHNIISLFYNLFTDAIFTINRKSCTAINMHLFSLLSMHSPFTRYQPHKDPLLKPK